MRPLDAIRRRLFGAKSLQELASAVGDFARDASDAITALVPFELRTIDMLYAEPMYVSFGAEPQGGILLVRVRELAALEATVSADTAVPFVWERAQTRARITAIDGLTVGAQYRFTFLRVG